MLSDGFVAFSATGSSEEVVVWPRKKKKPTTTMSAQNSDSPSRFVSPLNFIFLPFTTSCLSELKVEMEYCRVHLKWIFVCF